ncbi:MAG: LutB/LldF family L-lactate oxidation iron-sulfur protein [Acidobacteriaceae bacterium]
MANIFHTRIRHSIADVNLQAALDANAERRVRVRKEALASLDDPQALRARAHAVRADVIDHLEDYLEKFVRQVADNGIQVHPAADASQAVKIILDLAAQQGAKLVAKSKTMVSEEIGLNHALEDAGLKVIETDLGEYIVQLRGETPSHIITPAVHLRRQDVGKLFEEKLGLPYTEDISLMTNVARQTLRQVFLEADIGISGVNFGVAETGTICVVTNEGNGRMVTTLPRTHIALMGIERLVPTLDDLALMLSLLPRSATGQKLSVYTSLLNSPRRAGDADGSQERHLVLVDNGRRLTRGSELKEILYCIRCGACLNACPVFREIGGHAYVGLDGKNSPYPGPMGSVVSPALFGLQEFGHLARASSLCGACREACPVDIDLPKLLLRLRAGIGAGHPRATARSNAPAALKLGMSVFSLAAASPKRFALAQQLAGLFGSFVSIFTRNDPWMRLPALSGWGVSKDFPSPASKSFHARHANQLYLGEESAAQTIARAPAPTTNPVPEVKVQPQVQGSLVEQFAAELEGLGGKFVICAPNEAVEKIEGILQEQGQPEILAWDSEQLPAGLLQRLSTMGIQVHYPGLETLQECSRMRVGITGAAAAIAETGSLLLLGGHGKPLTASLLPEIHIAMVWEKDIYAHLDQVLSREYVESTPAAVIITGPSRTADIEMALTIGVHGPGKLYVVCLQNR